MNVQDTFKLIKDHESQSTWKVESAVPKLANAPLIIIDVRDLLGIEVHIRLIIQSMSYGEI